MAIKTMVTFKTSPEDKWGTEFDPATDRRFTAEEAARWANGDPDSFFYRSGLRTTHEGLVLATRERNGYDDSDFYAVVWDPENKTVGTVEYASTRYWTYANSATPDATPEVLVEVEAWLADQRDRQVEYMAAVDASEIRPGVTVEVVKGRKVPVGTVAEVVWRGVDRYRSGRWSTSYRVGLMVDGERVFLSEDNVRRVGAPTEIPLGGHPYAGVVAAAVHTLRKRQAATA